MNARRIMVLPGGRRAAGEGGVNPCSQFLVRENIDEWQKRLPSFLRPLSLTNYEHSRKEISGLRMKGQRPSLVLGDLAIVRIAGPSLRQWTKPREVA